MKAIRLTFSPLFRWPADTLPTLTLASPRKRGWKHHNKHTIHCNIDSKQHQPKEPWAKKRSPPMQAPWTSPLSRPVLRRAIFLYERSRVIGSILISLRRWVRFGRLAVRSRETRCVGPKRQGPSTQYLVVKRQGPFSLMTGMEESQIYAVSIRRNNVSFKSFLPSFAHAVFSIISCFRTGFQLHFKQRIQSHVPRRWKALGWFDECDPW